MNNIPQVKMGIIAVSRDCFPITLSETRRKAVVAALKNRGYDIYECPVIIEGGIDANVMEAYEDLKKSGINARLPRQLRPRGSGNRHCKTVRRPHHVHRCR